MKVIYSVVDRNKSVRGDVQLDINFAQQTWRVEKDDTRAWGLVGFSNQGVFEMRKDAGAAWLWDKPNGGALRNTIIMWDPPTAEADASHKTGAGRFFEPRLPEFRDGSLKWRVEVPSAQSGGGQLSPVRMKVQTILRDLLPCEFQDKKYNKNPYAPQTKFAGTTCGSLPSAVAYYLGRSFKLGGNTTGMPKEGRRYSAWVDMDGTRRPKFGDFYALVTGGMSDAYITHVGVILSAEGNQWVTADMGQGSGYSGKIDVKREYRPADNTLTGEKKDWRPVYGWIDIDAYMKNPKVG
jgi:hypothetical protein